MTRFEDGPARGQTLMLKRAAYFLRVVQGADGKFDALDQLDDTPKPDEKLFAYEINGTPGMAFVDGTKCRGAYALANYKVVKNQPTDVEMRTTEAWQEWVMKTANERGL